MPASNATFLAELDGREVVYKPIAGERPLWDFPDGTLADREVAAYLVSEALGLGRRAADLVRRGAARPRHAPGLADRRPEQDAVTLVRAGRVPEGWFAVFDGVDDRDRDVTLVHEDTAALRRMAVFDVLVNNADRKGGHVLPMPDGHRYGVDHGVTFHHEPKLRTVLWGWAGAPLTDEERAVWAPYSAAVRGELGEQLGQHLTDLEIRRARAARRATARARALPGPPGAGPPSPGLRSDEP